MGCKSAIIAAVIVAELQRVIPLSGSDLLYDPETGVADFGGAFRPIEMANAIAARLREGGE